MRGRLHGDSWLHADRLGLMEDAITSPLSNFTAQIPAVFTIQSKAHPPTPCWLRFPPSSVRGPYVSRSLEPLRQPVKRLQFTVLLALIITVARIGQWDSPGGSDQDNSRHLQWNSRKIAFILALEACFSGQKGASKNGRAGGTLETYVTISM